MTEIFPELYRLADLLRMMAATARIIQDRLKGGDADLVRQIVAEMDKLATKISELQLNETV